MSAFHLDGICAVWRRQLGSLLGNPVGYLFILAFVLAVGAVLVFTGEYRWFVRNTADLAPLHDWMPWLLVVLLPALAMGAWATEREQGTEELLLTLPLTPADAVIGKFLAIATHFTVALAATGYNVVELYWQGSPDTGLIIANYLGWWLAGLVAAALALLASVLTASVPIAFVIGVACCAIVIGHQTIMGACGSLITWISMNSINLSQVQAPDWFDRFHRGLIGVGPVLVAIGVIAIALGAAVLALSGRRWRQSRANQAWGQIASLIFGLVIAINLGLITSRIGMRTDLTSERVLSLAEVSRKVLRDQVKADVVLTVAVSQRVPPEMEAKQLELVAKVEAIAAANPQRIKVEWLRSMDESDRDGVRAKNEFGIAARDKETDTIAGRETVQVFLGAHVANGARTQLIEHFEPGQSVEYELVRAIRSVTADKKPVLGIALTDIDLLGESMTNPMMMMGGARPWAVVREWRRQYDVQGVNLDQAIDEKIDVLLVPQLSLLTQPQLERVHDWVWQGKPTLIIDDPLPIAEMMNAREDRSYLMPNQRQKRGQTNPMTGQPEGPGEAKCDTVPFYAGLGLQWDNRKLMWSEYNPSHFFRSNPVFQQFALMWCSRPMGSFPETAPVLNGISSLLFLAPGGMRRAEGAGSVASLQFQGLVRPVTSAPYIINDIEKIFTPGPGGRPEVKPDLSQPEAHDKPGFVVAHITGSMPSVYPRLDRAESDAAKTAADAAAAKDGEKEGDKPAAPAAKPTPRAGAVWDGKKPINVLVVADIDFLSDLTYGWYLGVGLDDKRMADDMRFLRELRNFQLAGNLVDALVDDQDTLELRDRFPKARPLARLEAVRSRGITRLRDEINSLTEQRKREVEDFNKAIEDERTRINANQALDLIERQRQLQAVAETQARETQVKIAKAELDHKVRLAKANADMRRDFETAIYHIRLRLLLIPSLLLLTLITIVWFNRRAAERAHIPTARKRSSP